MDQNTLTSLDPKLRETYERVMGMATPTGASNGNPPPLPPSQNMPPAPIPEPSVYTPQPPTPNTTMPPAQTPPQPDMAMYTSPSTQQAELAALQPTMTGGNLQRPSGANMYPNELMQSLPSPASVNQGATSTGMPPALRILYFAAGIIFFVVYAIFWLKIFKYPLPF